MLFRSQTVARLLFVLSAALAALALRIAWEAPLVGAAGLLLLLAGIGYRLWSRRRAARDLRSGDLDSVLSRWSSSMGRVPHPETMGPLLTATAFAAHGWTSRARELMREAERGPAWEAAIEQRLFLDALLFTFEGDSERALERAHELEQLPLPVATPTLKTRIEVLRRAVSALARAFAHQSWASDKQLLIEASDASPLVHWAMRYGAAIAAVDAGQLGSAADLVADAPIWPEESCFRGFHREILDELSRLAAERDAAIAPGLEAVDVSPAAPGTGDGLPAHVELADHAAASPTLDEEAEGQ